MCTLQTFRLERTKSSDALAIIVCNTDASKVNQLRNKSYVTTGIVAWNDHYNDLIIFNRRHSLIFQSPACGFSGVAVLTFQHGERAPVCAAEQWVTTANYPVRLLVLSTSTPLQRIDRFLQPFVWRWHFVLVPGEDLKPKTNTSAEPAESEQCPVWTQQQRNREASTLWTRAFSGVL